MYAGILDADDDVLCSKSLYEAKEVLNIIRETCKCSGLMISFKKTKPQIFSDQVLVKEPTLFGTNGQTFENVSEFRYLGKVVMNTDDGCFIKQHVAAKFPELGGVGCLCPCDKRSRKRAFSCD